MGLLIFFLLLKLEQWARSSCFVVVGGPTCWIHPKSHVLLSGWWHPGRSSFRNGSAFQPIVAFVIMASSLANLLTTWQDCILLLAPSVLGVLYSLQWMRQQQEVGGRLHLSTWTDYLVMLLVRCFDQEFFTFLNIHGGITNETFLFTMGLIFLVLVVVQAMNGTVPATVIEHANATSQRLKSRPS